MLGISLLPLLPLPPNGNAEPAMGTSPHSEIPKLLLSQIASPTNPSPPPIQAHQFGHWEDFYYDIHRHPETGQKESRTASKLAKELKKIGFQVTTGVGGKGVVAVFKNGEGPTALIRTEMDALPIQEETGLPYASQTPKVMHACGHDLHMAVFLGTAAKLIELKKNWKGTLVMIGQPAEEPGTGAKAMVDDGLFTRFPKPNWALALHASSSLPAGTVSYHSGYSLAHVDSVDITLHGKGGHGAQPKDAINPILIAASVVQELKKIADGLDPAQGVMSIGSIQSGETYNVIPEEAHLKLTVRYYEDSIGNPLKSRINEVTEKVSETMKAPTKPDIVYSNPVPAVYNDPAIGELLVPLFQHLFGPEQVVASQRKMYGEDFGVFTIEGGFPTFLFGLGSQQPSEKSRWAMAHSSHFAPAVEPTLETGITAMTQAALLLFHDFPIPPSAPAPGKTIERP